jgi:hypothetical protein
MHSIAETNLLMRARIELPAGLKLMTEEFREGWNFVGTRDARLLEKRILRRGWKFIRIADGLLRSGVGETPQAAIGNALNLALRHVSPYFNAVEINHIEWVQYPWFYLARVMVNPYRIQRGAVQPVEDDALSPRAAFRPRLLPTNAAELFPHLGSAMPMLREMLVLSRSSKASTQ